MKETAEERKCTFCGGRVTSPLQETYSCGQDCEVHPGGEIFCSYNCTDQTHQRRIPCEAETL